MPAVTIIFVTMPLIIVTLIKRWPTKQNPKVKSGSAVAAAAAAVAAAAAAADSRLRLTTIYVTFLCIISLTLLVPMYIMSQVRRRLPPPIILFFRFSHDRYGVFNVVLYCLMNRKCREYVSSIFTAKCRSVHVGAWGSVNSVIVIAQLSVVFFLFFFWNFIILKTCHRNVNLKKQLCQFIFCYVKLFFSSV